MSLVAEVCYGCLDRRLHKQGRPCVCDVSVAISPRCLIFKSFCQTVGLIDRMTTSVRWDWRTQTSFITHTYIRTHVSIVNQVNASLIRVTIDGSQSPSNIPNLSKFSQCCKYIILDTSLTFYFIKYDHVVIKWNFCFFFIRVPFFPNRNQFV